MGDRNSSLQDCFLELHALENYVTDYHANEDSKVDCGLVLMLIRLTKAKIEYVDKKYGIPIEDKDVVFLKDAIIQSLEWAMLNEKSEKERDEYLKSIGLPPLKGLEKDPEPEEGKKV